MAASFKLDDSFLSLIFKPRARFTSESRLFSLLFDAIPIVLSFYFLSMFFNPIFLEKMEREEHFN